ncbi:isochorismatase family protein [Klebsiella pneumoniae subsp. pneumoniae]|nr:isochorismatase family protein [Klebsiella pneumoniae subsp. pneumoniae]
MVIDLQEGILPFAGGPHRADEVVARAARLADKCRQQGSAGHHGPRGLVGRFRRSAGTACRRSGRGAYAARKTGGPTRPRWVSRRAISEVTKRQWGAFYGTDLELSCAAAGSTPLFSAASPPTSASNPPPAMPGAGF